MTEHTQFRSRSHIVVGVLIIFIGALLLFDAMDVIPLWMRDFFFRWQFIVVAVGLISLITNRNKAPGIIVIAAGLFFLAPEYFEDVRRYIIPVAIILIGLAIVARRGIKGYYISEEFSGSNPDFIDIVAIFSGGERLVTSRNFKGGKATAVFGGAEINMLNADLASQDVVIEATAVFGGITIIVPNAWEVVVDVDSVFGGFADKRIFSSDQRLNPEKRLFIKGAVVFGGGEIKSYK